MANQATLFQQFMNTWMGKGCDFDGAAPGTYQCVDLYKLWLNAIGYPNPKRAIGGTGFAEYIWHNRMALELNKYFDFVTSNYQYGDCLIYKVYAGYTPYSHVGFYVGKAGAGFHQCFGFNQSPSQTGCVINLPDVALLGGLRLKGTATPTTNATSSVQSTTSVKSEPGWSATKYVTVGCVVKSVALPIQDVKLAKSSEEVDMIRVDALGGYLPIKDVTEADASDGKLDDVISNLNAKVYLTPVKVTAIDVKNNLAYVNGYPVKCDYLLVKE